MCMVGKLLILQFLGQVWDALVECEVVGLQVGDLAEEHLYPGAGLLQGPAAVGGPAALRHQLRLQLLQLQFGG